MKTIDYNAIIAQLVSQVVDRCKDRVPDGSFRRVMWETYNPNKQMIQPEPTEEWDTEVIEIGTHMYTSNPFGHRSDDLYEEPVVPPTPPVGVLVRKIGHVFSSQQEVDGYIKSIGATKIGSQDWYGADLSKRNLYKNPREYEMYLAENSGGVWRMVGDPIIDKRTMMELCPETGGFNAISATGLDNSDILTKYVKFYEERECTYVGFRANLDVDPTIPGIPIVIPPVIPPIPWCLDYNTISSYTQTEFIDADDIITPQFSISVVMVEVSFPYSNLGKAILDALGKSQFDVKFDFDLLTLTKSDPKKSLYETMYDGLSSAAEEVGNASVAFGQAVLLKALEVFKKTLDQLLGIVGGAWDMISAFLPSIQVFRGFVVDILDLVFSSSPLQYLKTQIKNAVDSGIMSADEAIQSVYDVIGSSYDYASQRVKAGGRDISDAATDLWQYCLTLMQNGCVALAKLAADLAQIFTMPPLVPNPLWAVVTMVKEMFMKIEPLGMILSGNFPGFTAADVYKLVMEKVDAVVDSTMIQIEKFQDMYRELTDRYEQLTTELKENWVKESQYFEGMWGEITDAATEAYTDAREELEKKIDSISIELKSVMDKIDSLKSEINDIFTMGVDALKNIPLMEPIEKLLALAGTSFDELVSLKDNLVTGAKSMYDGFVEGAKSIKDYCKIVVDQISTLAISMVTEWINKLLGIFGLNIKFPDLVIPVPVIKFVYR